MAIQGPQQNADAPHAQIEAADTHEHEHENWHVAPATIPVGDVRYTLGDLLLIMAALRTPETGCPWDLAQDFSSIAPHTIEEAYEVAEAIAQGDLDGLRDELGDLLLQVIYHAQLARETGAFSFPDVVHGLASKLVRRHPHVFGSATANTGSDVSAIWEEVKAAERSSPKPPPPGTAAASVDAEKNASPERLLADIPAALPALTRSHKIGKRVVRAGFDWDDLAGPLDKLDEEVGELRAALGEAGALETGTAAHAHALSELGDVLFTAAQLSRKLGVDAEEVLRTANRKFTRRWEGVEELAAADGKAGDTLALAELEAYWQEIKRRETHDTAD
ncbi:MAG: nucleoside triphosphate pyrophosphohydrolase [Pseudomonadota bacterium]